MNDMTDPVSPMRARLSCHWLLRLRRQAELDALDSAVALGVLERVGHPSGVDVFRKGKAVAGWSIERARRLIQRSLGPGGVAGNRRAAKPSNAWEIPDDTLSGGTWDAPDDDVPSGTSKRRSEARRTVSAKRKGLNLAAIARRTEHSEAVERMLEDRAEYGDALSVQERGTDGTSDGGTALLASAMADAAPRVLSRRPRSRPVDRMSLIRLLRETAAPPTATAAAALIMLADAVARSGHDLADVLEILRRPKPIITITGGAPGFEAAFIDLLKLGFVLPGKTSTMDGYHLRLIDVRTADGSRRMLILFPGRDFSDGRETVDRQIALAVQNVYPILAVADDVENIPPVLLDVADLDLVCRPVTPDLVVATMKVVLGADIVTLWSGQQEDVLQRQTPNASLSNPPLRDEADVVGDRVMIPRAAGRRVAEPTAVAAVPSLEGCEVLTLADLALAIRPGMTPQRCLQLMHSLIARRRDHDEKPSTSSKTTTTRWSSKSSGETGSRRTRVGTGITIIQPETAGTDDNPNGRQPLRVETLSGYGAARDWALALKDDLALWKAGTLAWPDMSTRLLLAGPPGTGKTTFARALCNSLQLPLLATSVSTFLEPSYLGDVLARMSATFAEAEANAPCVLFIDEIDGIGRRGHGGNRNDDYWNSVVNRALELLDGAVRTEGVIIVGAANHPQAIDPALVRSGRLETRIDIPLPDIDALVGILRHHLGNDLASVAETDATAAWDPQNPPTAPGRTTPLKDAADRQANAAAAEGERARQGGTLQPDGPQPLDGTARHGMLQTAPRSMRRWLRRLRHGASIAVCTAARPFGRS